MSLDLTDPQTAPVPREFLRGSTLEFVLELPQEIAADFFVGTGITTVLESKLRLLEQAGAGGLIADLRPAFETGNTKIRFLAKTNSGTELSPNWVVADTSEWPIGPVEFDLLITRTYAGVTKKYRSNKLKFTITDGVT